MVRCSPCANASCRADRGDANTDYAETARLLGMSQPRLTHLMALLLLASSIQEPTLLGEIEPGNNLLRRVTQLV